MIEEIVNKGRRLALGLIYLLICKVLCGIDVSGYRMTTSQKNRKSFKIKNNPSH